MKSDKKKRRGRRRKRGPPIGHKGKARPVPDHCDEEDYIEMQSCPHCGNDLDGAFGFTEHWVEDILPARHVIRRHLKGVYWCTTCQRKVTASLTDAFRNERFGINLMLLVSFLQILGLTVGKTLSLLKELYGLELCDASVLRMQKRVADEMGEHYNQLLEIVRNGKDVHIDETGWRIDGINHWLWACTTKAATIYHVSRYRNSDTAKEILGPPRDGRVISSDFYSAYSRVKELKQKCLVHLMGELKKVEKKKDILNLEFGRFKKKLLRLIRDAIRLHNNPPEIAIKNRRIALVHKRLKGMYEADYAEPHCRRIAKRLMKHKDELFTFLEHDGVQWHNNDAERAIRPMVVIRKNSYGSRSLTGANVRAVLMSVAESIKKQKESFIGFGKNYFSSKSVHYSKG